MRQHRKVFEPDDNLGQQTADDLFMIDNRIITYHFMFLPDWEEGYLLLVFDVGDFLSEHDNIDCVGVYAVFADKLNDCRQGILPNFNPGLLFTMALVEFSSGLNAISNNSIREQRQRNKTQRRYAGDKIPSFNVLNKQRVGQIFHSLSRLGKSTKLENTYLHFPKAPSNGQCYPHKLCR